MALPGRQPRDLSPRPPRSARPDPARPGAVARSLPRLRLGGLPAAAVAGLCALSNPSGLSFTHAMASPRHGIASGPLAVARLRPLADLLVQLPRPARPRPACP